MREGGLEPMGGTGGIVDVDETYLGKTKIKKPSPQRKGRPYIHKEGGPSGNRAIVSLVERGGKVRSFHVKNADKPTVVGIVTANIAKESRLHTPTKAASTSARISTSPRTKPSTTLRRNMRAAT
jgi:hypothetical protein